MLLGEAQTLTDRFQFIDGRIQALSSEINLRMDTLVSDINGLTTNIATLNDKIATSLHALVKRPRISWMSVTAHSVAFPSWSVTTSEKMKTAPLT